MVDGILKGDHDPDLKIGRIITGKEEEIRERVEELIVSLTGVRVCRYFWRWVLGITAGTMFIFSIALVVMALNAKDGAVELKAAKSEIISVRQELKETKEALIAANAKIIKLLEERIGAPPIPIAPK